LPRHLTGDAIRIRQVVSNLLSNAVKFTPAGDVCLSVEIPRPGWIRFRVVDTGIGLSPEQQASLFQEFHQVDSSTTRKFGGTGLGLAISHRLVTLMEGHLRVESRLGEGATFIVELPLTSAETSAPPPRNSKLPEVRLPPGIRVLVAEDNPVNRKVVCAIVSRAGANVDIAENGRQAVDRHQCSLYDMILMDCQMPVLDGYEATALIRALPGRAAQVRIIGVTANAFVEDRDRCFFAGMNGYVAKPLTRQSLLSVMSQHLPEAPRPQPHQSTK
jgi:CheY-like chemotaxis protein/anti-sigma regulatory factor (Ser/Thr protein kinase)